MSDGAPQARDISPGRSALPVALVAVRVLVLALVVLGAGRRPVTDVQILQVERIATSPATPYRNFPVTTMPLETATDRTIGGDGASATVARIALLAFIADLAAASALAWGWGRRPAIVYLLLGLPLLSFIYLRFDLVSVALASVKVPVMVGLQLFLPESWTSDAVRMETARVPVDRQAFRSKPEIAIDEIDRMRAAGVHFGCVLADAGYGLSASFRHALSERGLQWAVGIPRHQKVYRGDVALIFPVAGRGRPRQRHIPDSKSISAEAMLAGASWRSVSWRHGTKGRLAARFAAVRVRVADGPTQRIRDMGGQHMPGDEAWLIGERRSSGERKYYLSNLPIDTPIKALASTIKARWVCEQAHQQLKEELGLDHFEGRSWHGLHRHALMTMIAYAFLQHRRLAKAKRGKKNRRTTASTKPASGPSRHRQSHASIASAMPALPKMAQRRAA